MAPTVFTLAVPIRAAADPESQTLGDLREPLFDGVGMARVPNLHTIESLILENTNLRLGPMIAQMRGDGESAHLVHEGRDFGEPRQRLLDVGGAATTQVAAERIADVFTGTAIDERARDVRASERTTRVRIRADDVLAAERAADLGARVALSVDAGL